MKKKKLLWVRLDLYFYRRGLEIVYEAMKYALAMMFIAVYVIWELRVLLACNRYFDDVRQRKHEVQSRPIILNQVRDVKDP